MQGKLFVIICTLILFINISTIGIISEEVPTYQEKSQSSKSVEKITENFDLKEAEELLCSTPRAFTENRGQLTNDKVQFYDASSGIWFGDTGVWIEFRESIESRVKSQESDEVFDPIEAFREPEPKKYRRIIVKQEFLGANLVQPVGRERLSWNNNYFYDNDPEKWCTDVPNYAEVYYENLFNGIDLRYYVNENGLKYDFIVQPFGDPDQIRIKYDGVDKLEIDAAGNMIVTTADKQLVDRGLFIYQTYGDSIRKIDGNFVKYNDCEVGFELCGIYDANRQLIIDPILEYSTYFGGQGRDFIHDVSADSSGCAYITGKTESWDLPVTTGAFDTSYNGAGDAFVTKFNPTLTATIYSTYIGGSSHVDWGQAVEVDAAGCAFVTGTTASWQFPRVPNLYDYDGALEDCFVLKLNASGSGLYYSTRVGGSDDDNANAIALLPNGEAFVTGVTYSSNFPTTPNANDTSFNGVTDVFVFRMAANGTYLEYSTFIGGLDYDGGRGIEIDENGTAYISGYTERDGFPTTPGAFNSNQQGYFSAFVTKLNYTGTTIIYSTFIGRLSSSDIAIDSNGYAIITGGTDAADYPVTPGAFDTKHGGIGPIIDEIEGFITKLNHNGSALVFSTFIGGSSREDCWELEVDENDDIYLTGLTRSSDFPITPNAFQLVQSGNNDAEAFILKLAANGSTLIYSSYLGGNGLEEAKGIGFDGKFGIFIAGETESFDFPVSPGAFINNKNTTNVHGFVARFSFEDYLRVTNFSVLLNNETTDTIYTRMAPYTLRVNVTDTFFKNDLSTVKLTLVPANTNIQFLYDHGKNQVTEILDPNDYVELNSWSRRYVHFKNEWILDFNVSFNWTYLDNELDNVQIYATSSLISPAWLNITKKYQIENELVFNGSLRVLGENFRRLKEFDGVGANETLHWTELKPMYKDSIHFYPPAGEVEVSVWDEDGNSWSMPSGFDQPVTVDTNAPNASYLDGHKFTINITGIPTVCDATNLTFTLRVDKESVMFTNETPKQNTWQTTKNVIVGITITDIGCGLVDGPSIKRALSTDNNKSWRAWREMNINEYKSNITAHKYVTLFEGTGNLIKWSARDQFGNGPVESDPYRILVDTQDLMFSEPQPESNNISTNETVEVGITISDETSGVNASSIQYAVSHDLGKHWSSWVSVKGLENGKNIQIKLNHTFPNGTANRIKWLASDIAGNGPTQSPVYTVKVNTWKQQIMPKVELISPKDNSILTNKNIELTWSLVTTEYDGITYDILLDTVNPPERVYKENHNSTSLVLDAIVTDVTYYWSVTPKVGNDNGICLSGEWSFIIRIPYEPVFDLKLELIPPSLEIKQGENGTAKAKITNLGDGIDKVSLIIKNKSNTLGLNAIIIEQGFPEIALQDSYEFNILITVASEASVGNGSFTFEALSLEAANIGLVLKREETLTIKIIKGKEIIDTDPEPDGTQDKSKKDDDYSMLILGIIIIVIIIIVILFFMLKKKKKPEEKPAEIPPPQPETPPQVQTQSVIATPIPAPSPEPPQALTSTTTPTPQLPSATPATQPEAAQPSTPEQPTVPQTTTNTESEPIPPEQPTPQPPQPLDPEP